jgi:hypothetical protein
VVKPEGKGPLGRPRGRWVFNVKNDLVEIGLAWRGLGCSGSRYEQVERSCICSIEPRGSIQCWEAIKWFNSQWPLE